MVLTRIVGLSAFTVDPQGFIMIEKIAFQDRIPNNHCFGCGSENPDGLQIKSFWKDRDESVCRYMPMPHQCAGPTHYLNGGIISTLIDCHTVCTAIAKGYEMAGRPVGAGETIWYATGKLEISFLEPVAIDSEVTLIARVLTAKEKKITLACDLYSTDKVCAKGYTVAVRVPGSWFG